MDKQVIISVIGNGNNAPKFATDLAYEVGKELAKRGAGVACGGLNGVMEAVCRGAKSEGGVTIGILPGNDPDEANDFVDFAIPTGMGHARNSIVVKSGKAVIAIAGAFGTLSEIGHALSDGNTVIGLHSWPLSDIKDGCMITADNPRDAVELALRAAKGVR